MVTGIYIVPYEDRAHHQNTIIKNGLFTLAFAPDFRKIELYTSNSTVCLF